jgi:hypothetical protein
MTTIIGVKIFRFEIKSKQPTQISVIQFLFQGAEGESKLW